MSYSKEQLALKAFIEAENEKFIARAKEQGATGWAVHVSDLEHWAHSDIFNIEQYKHYDAQTTHYDMYREVNNHRPYGIDYSKMTTEQIWDQVDLLVEEAKEQQMTQAQKEKANQVAYEARKKANILPPNNPFSGLKDMMTA